MNNGWLCLPALARSIPLVGLGPALFFLFVKKLGWLVESAISRDRCAHCCCHSNCCDSAAVTHFLAIYPRAAACTFLAIWSLKSDMVGSRCRVRRDSAEWFHGVEGEERVSRAKELCFRPKIIVYRTLTNNNLSWLTVLLAGEARNAAFLPA